MPEKALLGIDLGTSSIKAVLVDLDGKLLSTAAREYAFDVPGPGWAEQDPQVWVDAAQAVIRETLRAAPVPAGAVQAVGLSGQMHGLVCLDADARPVRPAVLWPDQRSAAQVERINRQVGLEQLGKWTANRAAAGFMLPSWLWLLENEPETARRTRYLVLPKDALRLALTGSLGVEASDASSTLLFDTAGRGWCLPLLERLGVDPRLLLAPHGSAEVAGGLTEEAARRTGLPADIPVIYGGSDQPMGLLGQGILRPGQLACAISTGGQLVAPLASPVYDPLLRCNTFCHVLDGGWYILAATLSAGLALRWLRDAVFLGLSYQELADLAAGTPSSEGVFFLPHLAGERTPYMDPGSRAGFWGLTIRHHRGHLVRAVMEGVVYSLRASLDLLAGLGIPVEQVVASGGGSRHPFWLRLMADIFNRPIARSPVVEASATGAAILGGVGAGLYPDAAEAVRRAVAPPAEITLPDPARAEAYQAGYETYQRLYPAFSQLRDREG